MQLLCGRVEGQGEDGVQVTDLRQTSSRAARSVPGTPALWLRAAALPSTLLVAWVFFPFCQTGPTLCIWKRLFHVQCFGCGLTQAICFLVHGHVGEALAYN